MEAATETKQGYKKTKIGWIPDDWEFEKLTKSIDLLTDYHSNGSYEKLKENVTLLEDENYSIMVRTTNFEKNNFSKNLIYIDENAYNYLKKSKVYYDDIIINKIANAGATYIMPKIAKPVSLGMNLFLLRTLGNVNAKYVYFQLKKNEFAFKNLASGTGTKTITKDDVRGFKIPLPPLPEQQKIAKILSTWDKAIEQTQKLIEQLKSRKKGLMQQLPTGKTRLKGFSGEWDIVRLGDVFEEITQKNDGQNHEPLTISAKLGFVSQRAKFDRVIAGGSLDKYSQLQRNDFSYNKGNSKTYQMGCIFLLEDYESAVVPFVYISFRANDSNVHNYFYKHWFANHGLDRQLKAIITSGARGDGLLNVNKQDFFSLKIPFPGIEEQKAIAKVLTTADKEIKAQETYLQQLQAQKKGLMQQLLTGQKRVNVNN